MEVTRGMSLSGEYYSTKGELMRLTLGNFDYHKNCFKEDKSKENLYFTGEVKEGFILNKDDIVTPLTEQAIGLLGSTAKIPCSGKYIQSQDVGLIKCNDKLNPNYAFYLIPSKLVRKQLSVAAQQTKIRHTSPDKIKGCTVWIPEYDKQEKIGKLLSSLDDKIALNNRIKAKLEQMAKRLYDYWFVQFDFPWSVSGEPCLHEFSRTDDGNARSDFPNADAKPYKSTGGKMVWNEELKREIPAGWEVKKMGEIALVKRGTTITEKDTTKGNVKVVAGGLDFSYYHNQSNRKANCITVSGSGENAGFVNFWREPIFASDCSTAQCENDIDTMLCYFALKMQEKRFYRISHKSAQPHIYPKDVAEIPIVVPNEAVKSKISDFFLKSNWKIALIEKETQKLTALRDRLLPLLMNGQVEVN